jgi:soluble lytic murein transglycosylase
MARAMPKQASKSGQRGAAARKPRSFRLAGGLVSFGLSFALCVALYLAAQRPDKTTQNSHVELSNWLSRAFYQIGFEIELLLGNNPHIAGPPAPGKEAAAPPLDPAAALGLDLTGLREALALYKVGRLIPGDAVAATARDPIVETTLAWVALREFPHDVGFARMRDFLDAHPGWPARDILERQMEEMLYVDNAGAEDIDAFFAGSSPETVFGRLALARAFKTEGDNGEAQRIIKALWRKSELPQPLETKIKTEFGTDLSKDDDKARADYLLYKDDQEAALRAAAVAGPQAEALAKLRIAAHNNAVSDKGFAKMVAKLPKPMQGDPGLIFAKAERLVHTEKFKDAAVLLLSAARDPALLVDGDAWWDVQKNLARKLLDLGETNLAYRLCAASAPETDSSKIEAAFEAGWIALRFMNDPQLAAKHFETAALYAETPTSIARAAYWQGRAADAAHEAAAKDFYETAAAQPETYYGQLARERLGLKSVPLRNIDTAATGTERDESVRVVELLYALGEKDLAYPLASAIAQHETSQSQLAALAKVIAAQRDAHTSLSIGKILAARRIQMDDLAFPTYGVPTFDPAENSASPAIVYAIARQESAFDSKAISSAGAKGLMQMIETTAKRTAQKIGVDFDQEKLISDSAFNAKLGAAHLGELLEEEKGSPILVFAAYNAGGHRVKQWIDAYGDPRKPDVDPVDWVERIPIAETRNYVQRVMENLTIYQARFGEAPRDQMLREIHAKL